MLRCAAFALCLLAISACHYDEEVLTCPVAVQLVYPEGSVEPYEGVRVELKDALASIYVDSTDISGQVCFHVPPGLYEASSSDTHVTYDYRYIFNGIKSQIVVSPDSANLVPLQLKMSRKRIVH